MRKMDRAQLNRAYINTFLRQRELILNDIKDFLKAILDCLIDNSISVQIGRNLSPFIESLCLLHALYGYPMDGGEGKS